MGVIYLITCATTKKQYVGQTTDTLATRWRKHKQSAKTYADYVNNPEKFPNWKGTCTYLYRAMNLYGIDDFTISIIEEAADDLLDDLEVYYISGLETLAPKGYNLKTGGDRSNHCDETKQLIGQKALEMMSNIYQKYRKHDELDGLPMYCIFVNIKGSDGIAINRHPLCERKSFTVKEYGTIEEARLAALMFLHDLEEIGIPYKPPKSGDDLPKGLRKIKGGYQVQKIIKGTLYYKPFTSDPSDDKNKQNAIDWLNNLIESKK